MPQRTRLGRNLATGAIFLIALAALTPLTVRYAEKADRERAMSDSRTLGRAILAFYLDTGTWPVNDDEDRNTGELSRLVGLPAEEISAAAVPTGVGDAANWSGGPQSGAAGAIEDQLIRNQREGLIAIYVPSRTAPEPPGWNGPYLASVPLDPWERPYVCNTRHLEDAGIPGVTRAAAERHAVFCISAGPNGVFDTSLSDESELFAAQGDDIGWPIQAGYGP